MKDVDELLKIAMKGQYKELCDKIKIMVLDQLLKYAAMKKEDERYITIDELMYMHQRIDEVRSEEHEREMRVIGGVIRMLLDRTDIKEMNREE